MNTSPDASLDSTPSDRSPTWAIALLIVIAGAGLWLRLWNLGRHSLWLDEAWLANSLLSDSIHDVVFKGPGDAAPNSTPFLLSLSIHYLTRLCGGSEFVLRLLPALFSTGSIVAIWLLARRLGASTCAALLAATLIAFNPVSIDFAKELKQYAGDTFWIPMILIGICRFSARPTWPLALVLAFGALIALGFAQTVALAMPGACVYLAIRSLRERRGTSPSSSRRASLLQSASVVSIWCAGTALIYVLIIRHQSSERLVAFWEEFFPPSAQPSDVWRHARLHVAGFFKWFFEALPNLQSSAGEPRFNWPAITMALAALGSLYLAIKRPAQLVLLIFMPGLVALGLSTRRMFPFGAVRVNLFMLPFVILVVAFGIDTIGQMLIPLRKAINTRLSAWANRHLSRWNAVVPAVAIAGIAVTLALPRIDKERHEPKGREHIRPLIERMLADDEPSDIVLALDTHVTHAWKYYTRDHPIEFEVMKTRWSDRVLLKSIANRTAGHRRVWIPVSHFDRARIEEILGLLASKWPNLAVMDRRDAIVAFFDDEPMPTRLSRDDFELRVPNGRERAELAVDNDATTHWMTSSPREAGWHVDLELKTPMRLSAIVLNTPIWPDDWSHELYAHVQTDANDRWSSADVSVWEGPRTTIRFEMNEPIRRIRLTNAERHEKFHWSIHELEIWARSGTPSTRTENDGAH